MIDLQYSRERMLEDICAGREAQPLSGLSDPRSYAEFVSCGEARLLTRVGAPADILGLLETAFAARFGAVEPDRLQRNLLLPIKKALGNAHKRGNRLDPRKRITVEVVVTRRGAFVEVSDEGEGFDVEATCARFRAGAEYFAHSGSGFRKFEKAASVVSFADGGRTFRACYCV